MSVIAAQM